DEEPWRIGGRRTGPLGEIFIATSAGEPDGNEHDALPLRGKALPFLDEEPEPSELLEPVGTALDVEQEGEEQEAPEFPASDGESLDDPIRVYLREIGRFSL